MSVKDQISRYTASAKAGRSRKSDPTKAQTAQASRTSRGKAISSGTRQSVQKGLEPALHRRSSWAGYQGGSATHLQMNGTGYSNPAHHIARYSRKGPTNLGMNFANPKAGLGFTNSTSMNYTGKGMSAGSPAKLSKMLKLNRLF